jgi:hypothetical protein
LTVPQEESLRIDRLVSELRTRVTETRRRVAEERTMETARRLSAGKFRSATLQPLKRLFVIRTR